MHNGNVIRKALLAAALGAAGSCISCSILGRPVARAGGGGNPRAEIILLDLNYTLVANRKESIRRGGGDPGRRIASERYRDWLRELLRGKYVILITARPSAQRDATLANIRGETGWAPDEAYFNERDLPPAECKRDILERYIFPRHGRPGAGGRYVAIESNPRTAAMYADLDIPGLRVWEAGQYGRAPRGE